MSPSSPAISRHRAVGPLCRERSGTDGTAGAPRFDASGRGVRNAFYWPVADRIHEHWNVDGLLTLTAPAERAGDTYRIHHAFNLAFDLTTGSVTGTGLGFGRFDDPGGPLALIAGRVVDLPPMDPHLTTCAATAD